jgi:hypothetical protein
LIALSARAKSASHGITLDVTLSILPVFWIYLCTFLYSPNPLLEVVPSSSSRLGLYIAQNEVAWDKKEMGKCDTHERIQNAAQFQTATVLHCYTKRMRVSIGRNRSVFCLLSLFCFAHAVCPFNANGSRTVMKIKKSLDNSMSFSDRFYRSG